MQFIPQDKQTRVRFAPSPTGYLHVGGARTAILNWLFARKYGGTFLLRIEDTDAARSGDDMVKAIIEGLTWLGLDWDEEIVHQSHRLQIYSNHVHKLIEDNKAYKCFCTRGDLEAQRDRAKNGKQDYRYRFERKCFNLTPDEIAEREKRSDPYSVRLLLAEGETVFTDAVYGEIKVNHEQLDDFILLRSDGFPTYHFAVVIDDYEMGITHVIRGDDHLSNTPKHIQIYHALGWQPPRFAHVPLILGADKQRLSKRHGATAIGQYETAGYLPDAMLNFLCLLGWSPGDDRELFSRTELIKAFSIEGISKKSAVFDEQKLEWMNGQYLNAMSDPNFYKIMIDKLLESKIIDENTISDNDALLKSIAGLIKPRVKRLSDLPDMTRYFFTEPHSYDEAGIKKHWKTPDQIERFKQLAERLQALREFNVENIEAAMRGYAEELGVGAGKIIQPIRLAVTGIANTPGMFEIMVLLGKNVVVRRIEKAVLYLENNPMSA